MEGLIGFVTAATALAGSPGPATLSLAAAGATYGPRRGIAFMAGILVGMVAVMAIVATGVTQALLAMPGIAPAVTLLAAGYFLYLAFRIATAPPLRDAHPSLGLPTFSGGMLLSLINPKGYAAMAGLFSSFNLLDQRGTADAVAKVIVVTVIISLVNTLWLVAGGAMTGYFRNPRVSRALNILFALLLLGSALALWL